MGAPTPGLSDYRKYRNGAKPSPGRSSLLDRPKSDLTLTAQPPRAESAAVGRIAGYAVARTGKNAGALGRPAAVSSSETG